MANFVPRAVAVMIRVNQKMAENLMDLGIGHDTRSREQEQALIKRHAEAAEAIGRNPYRGGRVDAAGNHRSDSGTPIFGWDPKGRVNVSAGKVLDDLQNNGMVIDSITLSRKAGDSMSRLEIWLKPASEGAGSQFRGKAMEELQAVFNRNYGHLHGFRNPDSTMTFNFAMAVMDVPAERVLRITGDWNVACVKC